MDCLEEGCDFHFIENKNGLIQYTLHRILRHSKTSDRPRTKEVDEMLVAILEKTKKEKI